MGKEPNNPLPPTDAVRAARRAQIDERRRVAGIIARDRGDRLIDQRRQTAIIEVMDGTFVNLVDTVIPPTPEQIEKGDFQPYTPGKEDGTVRTVSTVRNMNSRIYKLLTRGVIDNDLFVACRWYRARWELSGLPPIVTASYAPQVSGDREHGAMAKTVMQAEARSDYRWAREFVPIDVRDLFEMVVLEDLAIKEAKRRSGCRYANAIAAFRRGGLNLHAGISHLLQIDPMKNKI